MKKIILTLCVFNYCGAFIVKNDHYNDIAVFFEYPGCALPKRFAEYEDNDFKEIICQDHIVDDDGEQIFITKPALKEITYVIIGKQQKYELYIDDKQEYHAIWFVDAVNGKILKNANVNLACSISLDCFFGKYNIIENGNLELLKNKNCVITIFCRTNSKNKDELLCKIQEEKK